MAGIRIRDLIPTDAPPDGALLPVDSSLLDAAQSITPKDLVDAASFTITVDLTSNPETNVYKLNAALATYAESGNRRGTLKLPKGIYLLNENVTLTAAHSGLTIDGEGCTLYRISGFTAENSVININLSTLLDPMGRGDGFTLGPNDNQFQFPGPPAPQPRYPNYQVDDAIILFKTENLSGERQPVQQVAVITDVDELTGTITVDDDLISGVDAATYLFNGRKLSAPEGVPAGVDLLTILGTDAAELFYPDCWIYVTDGVGELETYGEFVRVEAISTATDNTVLTLQSCLRNSYLAGRAAVVPPSADPVANLRSRWGEDITIRGLTFGGSADIENNADLGVKFCVNFTLDRVRCVLATTDEGVASNGMVIVTSGHVTLRECEFVEGGVRLAMNGVRDAWVENCRLGTSLEEFGSDITFLGCQIVEKYNHRLGTVRVHAIHSQFWNLNEFAIGDDCSLIGCKVIGSQTDGDGSLALGGNRCIVRDLEAVVGPLLLKFLATGTGHYVGQIRGNAEYKANVQLVAGSGGHIDGPVDGSIAGYDAGAAGIPGSWTYTTVAQVPLTLGEIEDPVILGRLDGLRPAMWLRVHLQVEGYGVSFARTYAITRGYQYPGAWYVCRPLTEGRYDYTDDTDFDLELFDGPNDVWLRLRRTGASTTSVEVIARIESTARFTPDGTPLSSAAAIGFHESTTLTQRNGLAFLHGPVFTRISAPADDDLKAKECALWYDPTDSTPRLVFRAKTNDGTFANLAIALTPEP